MSMRPRRTGTRGARPGVVRLIGANAIPIHFMVGKGIRIVSPDFSRLEGVKKLANVHIQFLLRILLTYTVES
jgi:hypothetical protein